MGVRLEIDIDSSATRFVAGGFERENLGVLHAAVSVASGSDHIAVSVSDDRANVRIGRG